MSESMTCLRFRRSDVLWGGGLGILPPLLGLHVGATCPLVKLQSFLPKVCLQQRALRSFTMASLPIVLLCPVCVFVGHGTVGGAVHWKVNIRGSCLLSTAGSLEGACFGGVITNASAIAENSASARCSHLEIRTLFAPLLPGSLVRCLRRRSTRKLDFSRRSPWTLFQRAPRIRQSLACSVSRSSEELEKLNLLGDGSTSDTCRASVLEAREEFHPFFPRGRWCPRCSHLGSHLSCVWASPGDQFMEGLRWSFRFLRIFSDSSSRS